MGVRVASGLDGDRWSPWYGDSDGVHATAEALSNASAAVAEM